MSSHTHTHTHLTLPYSEYQPQTVHTYKGSNTTGIARISPTLKLFLTDRQERIARNDVKSPCDFPIFVGICVNLKPAFFFRAGSGDTAPLFCFSHSHLAVVRRFLCPKLRSTPPLPLSDIISLPHMYKKRKNRRCSSSFPN